MLRELGDWLDDNGDTDGQKDQEPVAAAITDNNGAEGVQDSSDGECDNEDSPAVTTRTTMDRVRSAARALIRLAGDAFALGMWSHLLQPWKTLLKPLRSCRGAMPLPLYHLRDESRP
jgi:hypothetical protein